MPPNNGNTNQVIVNDGEGMACEHCEKAKEDVICITVGNVLTFLSLECFNEAASLALETGKMSVLV